MSWKATKGGLLPIGSVNITTSAGSSTITLNIGNNMDDLIGRLWGTVTRRILAYPKDGKLNGAEAILPRTSVTWTTNGIIRNELNNVPMMAMVRVSDGDDSHRGYSVKIPIFPGDNTVITISWPAGLGSAMDFDFYEDCVPA